MSNKIHFLIEDGRGEITTDDEAIDYIVDEGNEFSLKNLTNLTNYKELHSTPEDENLENRMAVVIERAKKVRHANICADNSYKNYTEDQKTLFLYNLKIKAGWYF